MKDFSKTQTRSVCPKVESFLLTFKETTLSAGWMSNILVIISDPTCLRSKVLKTKKFSLEFYVSDLKIWRRSSTFNFEAGFSLNMLASLKPNFVSLIIREKKSAWIHQRVLWNRSHTSFKVFFFNIFYASADSWNS